MQHHHVKVGVKERIEKRIVNIEEANDFANAQD